MRAEPGRKLLTFTPLGKRPLPPQGPMQQGLQMQGRGAQEHPVEGADGRPGTPRWDMLNVVLTWKLRHLLVAGIGAVVLASCGAVALRPVEQAPDTSAVVDKDYPRFFSMRPIWGRDGVPDILVAAPIKSAMGDSGVQYFQINPSELWEGKVGGGDIERSRNSLFLESEFQEIGLGQSLVWEPGAGTLQNALVVEFDSGEGKELSRVQAVRVWGGEGVSQRHDVGDTGLLTSIGALDSFLIRLGENDRTRTLGISGWSPMGGEAYQLGVWLLAMDEHGQVVCRPEFMGFQQESGESVVANLSLLSKAEVSMEAGYSEAGSPFAVGIVTMDKQVHTFALNLGGESRPIDLRRDSSLDRGWPILLSSAASQAGIAGDEFFVRSVDPQYLGLSENAPWQILSLSSGAGMEEKSISVRVELPANELLPRGAGSVEGMGLSRDAKGNMMGVAVVLDFLWNNGIRAYGFHGDESALEADTVEPFQVSAASFARSGSVLCRMGGGDYLLVSPSALHFHQRVLPLPAKGSLSMLLLREEETVGSDGETATSLVPVRVMTLAPEDFFPSRRDGLNRIISRHADETGDGLANGSDVTYNYLPMRGVER